MKQPHKQWIMSRPCKFYLCIYNPEHLINGWGLSLKCFTISKVKFADSYRFLFRDYMAAETTLRVCEAIQHVWLPQSDESQTKSQDNVCFNLFLQQRFHQTFTLYLLQLLSSEHLLGVTPNMLMDQGFQRLNKCISTFPYRLECVQE